MRETLKFIVRFLSAKVISGGGKSKSILDAMEKREAFLIMHAENTYMSEFIL